MKKLPKKSRINEIATMLFEQDTNSLGLNVIWCSDYSRCIEYIIENCKMMVILEYKRYFGL